MITKLQLRVLLVSIYGSTEVFLSPSHSPPTKGENCTLRGTASRRGGRREPIISLSLALSPKKTELVCVLQRKHTRCCTCSAGNTTRGTTRGSFKHGEGESFHVCDRQPESPETRGLVKNTVWEMAPSSCCFLMEITIHNQYGCRDELLQF